MTQLRPYSNKKVSELAQTTSIIIPAFGKCIYLERVLKALTHQTVQPKEIIIVHSGDIELQLSHSKLPANCHLYSQSARLYAGAARNLGVHKSTGTNLIFLDSDVLPEPRWLHEILKNCLAPEGQFQVGAIDFIHSGGYWGLALWLLEFSGMSSCQPTHTNTTHGASANFQIFKVDFLKTNGFIKTFPTCEDKLLFTQLRKNGYKTTFNPKAIVRHFNLPGFEHFKSHLFRLGKYSASVHGVMDDLLYKLCKYAPFLVFFIGLIRTTKIFCRAINISYKYPVVLTSLFPGALLGITFWSFGFLSGISNFRSMAPKHPSLLSPSTLNA